MAEKSINCEGSMQCLQKGMEELEDAEFRAYREWVRPEMMRLFDSQGLGIPSESDYRFSKKLYERIHDDIGNAFPCCIPTIQKENLAGVHALFVKRYTIKLIDELEGDFKEKYNLTDKKLLAMVYLVAACVLDLLVVDNTSGEDMLNEEIENNETQLVNS
jgi:hypothetical protein